MKARPILFSGPMIQALLDGRKTQTRRVVKDDLWLSLFAGEFDEATGLPWVENPETGYQGPIQCPYGQPGDLLWVRETWGVSRIYDGVPPREIQGAKVGYASSGGVVGVKLRPSIHMPRWMSRFTLRITDRRVERVQDISEADASAEGFPVRNPDSPFGQDNFRMGWDRLNAARGYGWDANPWVWALSFEVIKANVDAVLERTAA